MTRGDSQDLGNTKTKKAVAYLEDKQGIWSLLARTTQLPTGYQTADVQVVVLTHYRNEIEAKFAELQLCSEHWKADRISIKNFSSWRKS
jgi:glycine cleavage system regulatory protein